MRKNMQTKNSSATNRILFSGENMHVVKIVELIGSSPEGWQEATQAALSEATKTVKNIKGIHVKRCTAKVQNNKIVEYRAVVKIAFAVEHER